jgi:hypothetical protein
LELNFDVFFVHGLHDIRNEFELDFGARRSTKSELNWNCN